MVIDCFLLKVYQVYFILYVAMSLYNINNIYFDIYLT